MTMRNIRTIFVTVIAVLLFAVLPGKVSAEEQVCTQVYGGGVVCGVATEHEPVDTAGINLGVLGAGLLVASKGLSVLSKKIKEGVLTIEG